MCAWESREREAPPKRGVSFLNDGSHEVQLGVPDFRTKGSRFFSRTLFVNPSPPSQPIDRTVAWKSRSPHALFRVLTYTKISFSSSTGFASFLVFTASSHYD